GWWVHVRRGCGTGRRATTANRHQRRASTPQPTPARPPSTVRPPNRWPTIVAILRQTPALPRRARDIAGTLGITSETSLNSFCVQMSTWARHGRLTKTAPATYLITPAFLTTTP